MRLDDFSYTLPRKLIASYPLQERDKCRLLILNRARGDTLHRWFFELPQYLRKGDVLVLNNTRVLKARLWGRKETGGKVEVLLLTQKKENLWEGIVHSSRPLKEGQKIIFSGGKIARVEKKGGGKFTFSFFPSLRKKELSQLGEIPIPPYLGRAAKPLDEIFYQTVYARENGAVAAPTAGLHFTPGLLKKIEKRGVKVVEITLHTGWASFFILKEKEVEKNTLPAEYFRIEEKSASCINRAKEGGGRVISVGTSTLRALETQAERGKVKPGEGWTELFIYPGFKFQIVNGLLTNFHHPRTSLLLLVCAFGGKEKVLSAYEEAVKKGYRFLSYGDSMLIL